MKVKVWYEIDKSDYYSGYQLKIYYKYKVSSFKSRRGGYIALKKNEGLPNGSIFETINEFYKRVANRLQNEQKLTQDEVTKKILTENEELNAEDLAFKLAKKGFKFTI